MPTIHKGTEAKRGTSGLTLAPPRKEKSWAGAFLQLQRNERTSSLKRKTSKKEQELRKAMGLSVQKSLNQGFSLVMMFLLSG